jgi:hypothetical protein
MVDKICLHSGLFDVFYRQIARQLVDDCADHFQVAQFFSTAFVAGNVLNKRGTRKMAPGTEYAVREAVPMAKKELYIVQTAESEQGENFVRYFQEQLLLWLKKRGQIHEQGFRAGLKQISATRYSEAKRV